MRPILIHRLSSLALLLLPINILSGCGGSSNIAQPTNPSTPQATEILYANGVQDLHVFSIDVNTGFPTQIQSVPHITNWTIAGGPMVIPSSAKFLYAIDDMQTGIYAFTVDADGMLTAINGSPFSAPYASPDPVSNLIGTLTITPNGAYLYAIGDAGGLGTVYQINSTSGALTATTADTFWVGGSPSQPTQPRQSIIDPGGHFLYLTDWTPPYSDSEQDGLSGVDVMAIDSTTGNLTTVPNSPFVFPWNSQPNQLVMDPTAHFIYVGDSVQSSANPIEGFTRDSATGALTQIPGSPFDSGSSVDTATPWIVIHPSGKFLYAYSEYGQSIYAFEIDSVTGALSPVPGSPFLGQQSAVSQLPAVTAQGPMVLDPSGAYLYVACSDWELEIYKVDQTTGSLSVAQNSPVVLTEAVSELASIQAP